MPYPVKIDHVEQGLSRMLSFWDDKPIIKGLFESYLRQLESVETTLFQLLEERSIYTAVGVQLDVIGAMFGVPRNGKDDEQYRPEILRKIAQQNDDGTTEVFMDALRLVTGSYMVDFFEHLSGDIHAYCGEGLSPYLYKLLKPSVPVGVDLTVMVDEKRDSFVPVELIPRFDKLINEQGSYISTENLDNILVSISIAGKSFHGYLPEILDSQSINPLAEIIGREVVTEEGRLLYEDGFMIIDRFGNKLKWS